MSATRTLLLGACGLVLLLSFVFSLLVQSELRRRLRLYEPPEPAGADRRRGSRATSFERAWQAQISFWRSRYRQHQVPSIDRLAAVLKVLYILYLVAFLGVCWGLAGRHGG